MDFPQLIGPYYTPFSEKAESQSCKNLYLEAIESGVGRNQFAMYRSHGLQIYDGQYAPNGSVGRGLLELNGHLFRVRDETIFDLLAGGVVNRSVGPINDDGLLVSIDASGSSLFVVSVGVLYRVNGGILSLPITPFTPSAVAVFDTYVVCTVADSNQFFFSTDDGQTWDPLNFQTAEAYPNQLINLIVDHQELWLFGDRRTQVFDIGTNPSAPFVANVAGVIEMGLAAARAIVKLDNSIFWFGSNKDGDHMVWRANGYTPVRVSNHAVENMFRSYPNHQDASIQTYQINGHSCLRLTFPSANNGLGATWEYDVATNNWYEMAWWNSTLNRYERHRGNCYASAFQKIIVDDYSNGCLYEMSPDFYSDFGYPIRWERRTPHSTKDGKRIQYKRLDLFMQAGVGTLTPIWLNDHSLQPDAFAEALNAYVSGSVITQDQANVMQAIYNCAPYNQSTQLPPANSSIMEPIGFFDWGNDPQVGMRYSNDGAENFGPTRYRRIGQAGSFNKRIYWGGIGTLGMARDRVWEISGDAPVKTAIVQGTFDAEACLT